MDPLDSSESSGLPERMAMAARADTVRDDEADLASNWEDLTVRQKRFVEEYLLDGCKSAQAAAIRAGYARVTAASEGYQLLHNPRVKRHIDARMARKDEQMELSVASIIKLYWDIATADPNDIVRTRAKACRHCYGREFAYQFKGMWEYCQQIEQIMASHERESAERARRGLPAPELKIPDVPMEGDWYDWMLPPHPKCPHCEGKGDNDIVFNDTSQLTGKARWLYRGVKMGKNGIEVLMRNQDHALQMLAGFFGITPDSLKIQINQGAQLVSVEQLAGMHPQALQVLEEMHSRGLLLAPPVQQRPPTAG